MFAATTHTLRIAPSFTANVCATRVGAVPPGARHPPSVRVSPTGTDSDIDPYRSGNYPPCSAIIVILRQFPEVPLLVGSPSQWLVIDAP